MSPSTEILSRRNTVLEALRGTRRMPLQLWLQKGLPSKLTHPFRQAARARQIRYSELSKQRLSELVGQGDHQGVAVEVPPYPYASLDEIMGVAEARNERPFILILDLVQGPQNVGTLLRTAEICGVHGVIMQERRAPDINPTIAQYSVGATEHLHIAQVTNLTNALSWLKAQDVWIAGLDFGADAQPLPQVDLNIPLGVVVGHEGDGLRRRVRDACDFIVELPMRGHVESLNASVAGSVMLYQAWQARGFAGQRRDP